MERSGFEVRRRALEERREGKLHLGCKMKRNINKIKQNSVGRLWLLAGFMTHDSVYILILNFKIYYESQECKLPQIKHLGDIFLRRLAFL